LQPQPPQRVRKLTQGWLQAYRDYIVKQESPDIFHFWIGCQLIAAALKRNVWIDRGAYKVYPNQYVFLIAKSGSSRKSSAMDIGLDLIKEVDGIRTLYGRMTVEGLIDQMDHASISPDGRIKPDGSIFVQADELAYIFGKAAYVSDLLDFFTAAYTSKARLDFLTRGKGICTVRNPCPTLLAACTVAQLGNIFPSMTLVSGFMARVLMVYGQKGVKVAKPVLNRKLEDPLIHDLGCLAELHGPVVMLPDVEAYYDSWYEQMGESPIPELEAFYERKHDHVLKTALVLSISESNKMVISIHHLEGAIKAIAFIEKMYPKAIESIGATQQSLTVDVIEAILMTVHPQAMSHSVLLRRVYKRLTYGAEEFKMYIDSLKEQNKIKEKVSVHGVTYQLMR